jgi:hypothetical protein
MDQSELLRRIVLAFEGADVEYLLVGSVASAAYGEPRLTLDIDVVADIPEDRLARFLSFFPREEFYVSWDAVSEAVRQKRQFNIIHPASGLKVDVVVRKPDAFDRSRFSRKRAIRVFPDLPAVFASPEDVIIKKLEYYRDGGTEKHLRDISGILRVSGDGLDLEYIKRWADAKDLSDVWLAVLSRSKPQ